MIVVMSEYNLRNCSDFTNGAFPHQLVDDVIPTAEKQFRVAPGARNRALAGLSSGGGCVFNTLFKDPATFAYIGTFSPHWPESAIDDLVQNHQNLLTNPAINKDVRLFWLTKGGPDDEAPCEPRTAVPMPASTDAGATPEQ
jgi:enterochelin esterase-like enzyme